MSLLNIKKSSFLRRAKSAWPFFSFLSKRRQRLINQTEVDKQLVYSLSPRKVPNRRQLHYLGRFLKPKEAILLKICLLIVAVNAVYLLTLLVKKHLDYLPIAGGTYTEGVVGYPKTINPLYAVNRDIDSDLSYLIYSRLLHYDMDGRLVNDLAEQVDISEDAKQYTVRIHNDAKWHNGEPLTIEDVLFTFNLIKDPDYRSPLRSALINVQAEKIDDYTIKFTLTEPYAPFPELLTFGILPKSIWSAVSPNAAVLSDVNLKPVGSGPFKLQTFLRSKNGDIKEYHLIANEDYYGKKPYLKGINFIFFADRQEAIDAFNDRKVLGLNYLPVSSRSSLLAQNSLNFHDLVQPQITAIFFNQSKNAGLANKETRVALASAINRPAIISDIFAGAYKLTDGPILNDSRFFNNQISRYQYDPESAKKVFSSKPLTVTITVIDTNSNVAVAEKIKAYWEQVGVTVNLKTVSSEQAASIIKDRDFEVILYGESVGGDPDVYAFWHSSQIGGKGLNLAGYNNTEVDQLLTQARSLKSETERQEKYNKFQELVTADLPAIFLYSPTYSYIQNKELKGFSGNMIIDPADRFYSVSDWYLKTKKKLAW